MKIALIQTNPLVGDFAGITRRIVEQLGRARDAQCGLALLPELALCGAPPGDLADRADFLAAHDRALDALLTHSKNDFPELTCVVGGLAGTETWPDRRLYNAAFVFRGGVVIAEADKRRLGNHDGFDAARRFDPGREAVIFPCGPYHCALTIGEDILGAAPHPENSRDGESGDPLADFALGAVMPDLLVNIAAMPYHRGLPGERRDLFTRLCRSYRLPLAHVNQAGGQAPLIYDGRSLLMDDQGRLRALARAFAEDFVTAEFPEPGPAVGLPFPEEDVDDLHEALLCGIRDYFAKSGFQEAIIGLSGGIDSALTAALACRALGPGRVLGVALPSPYTAELSVGDARRLAENLGCRFESIPIEPLMTAYQSLLNPHFAGTATADEKNVTGQNIQARIRGAILMALANRRRGLVLATGNKSELAVGYCTLYGDMCGGLAPLADLLKTEVYRLARFVNRDREIIPESTIVRPPTAELGPGQFDQDDLPPYEVLDEILRLHLDSGLGAAAIARLLGVDVAVPRDMLRRVRLNEYKRAQAAPGLKLSKSSFAADRRYPLLHGFVE